MANNFGKLVPGAINPKSGRGYGSLAKGAGSPGLYCRLVEYKNVERSWYVQVEKIRNKTKEGLKQALDYFHEQIVDGAYPQEPYKTGRLHRAWEVNETTFSSKENPSFTFGYNPDETTGAPYVWYVHEMTSPPYGDIEWTKPNSGPQWMTAHLKMDKPQMLAIVRNNVKLSKV